MHLLQIWIIPNAENLQPGYEQTAFSVEERRNQLRLIASSDGRDGSVTVNQDVSLFASILDSGQQVEHAITSALWLVAGCAWFVEVNGERAESRRWCSDRCGVGVDHPGQ